MSSLSSTIILALSIFFVVECNIVTAVECLYKRVKSIVICGDHNRDETRRLKNVLNTYLRNSSQCLNELTSKLNWSSWCLHLKLKGTLWRIGRQIDFLFVLFQLISATANNWCLNSKVGFDELAQVLMFVVSIYDWTNFWLIWSSCCLCMLMIDVWTQSWFITWDRLMFVLLIFVW